MVATVTGELFFLENFLNKSIQAIINDPFIQDIMTCYII